MVYSAKSGFYGALERRRETSTKEAFKADIKKEIGGMNARMDEQRLRIKDPMSLIHPFPFRDDALWHFIPQSREYKTRGFPFNRLCPQRPMLRPRSIL